MANTQEAVRQMNFQQDLVKAIKYQQSMETIQLICASLQTLNFGIDFHTNPLLMVCTPDLYNPDLIKLFIENGADSNFKNSIFESTPIMYLAEFGALDMVKYLLDNGANPHLYNKSGNGLMYYSKLSRVEELINFVTILMRDTEKEKLTLENEELRQKLEEYEKKLKMVEEMKKVVVSTTVGDTNFEVEDNYIGQ